MAIQQSLPFFNALIKAPKELQVKMLQSFPSFVVDDLLEIIVNVVRGNVNISKAKKEILKQHKKPLLSLVHTKNKKVMRQVLYKQKGGFIGTLLPIIVSAIAGLISNI